MISIIGSSDGPRPVHILVPGRLDQATGGYIYDHRMVIGLHERGWSVTVHELGGRFPLVDQDTCQHAEATLRRLPDDAIALIDGLVTPAVSGSLWAECRRLRLVMLIHHPLAFETGLSPEEAATLHHLEQASLSFASRVICTSPATARSLVEDFAVPLDRIGAVLPGMDPRPRSTGSTQDGPVIVCVGSVVPRKGYDVLITALEPLRDLAWTLRIVGSVERDAAHAQRLRSAITAAGLGERVRLEGELSAHALDTVWAGADLFVSPSRFEGYGMAVAEALARGLPLITTEAGALAETVPDGAAVKVPMDDPIVLTEALRTLLSDPERRRALADRSFAAGQGLPDWSRQVAAFAHELELAG